MQTIAAINSIKSKYRAKFNYDKKANVKYFREEEMVNLIK